MGIGPNKPERVFGVVNYIFSKTLNFLEFFCNWIFWRNFLEESFWQNFFWEDFLGEHFLGALFCRILGGGILWEEFFVYIGIDLFVKILSQCKEGRKEGRKNFNL